MAVAPSQFTPDEPDWGKAVREMREALAPDETRNPPDADRQDPVFLSGVPEQVVYKFQANRTSEVQKVIERVLAANIVEGTPRNTDLAAERVPAALVTLQGRGYVQAAVDSRSHPGVYVIWSAYRRYHGDKTEYRVSIWVVPLATRVEVDYLIGSRNPAGVSGMFFRRQHVVRAVHASGPVYYDTVHTNGSTFQTEENKGVFPHWIDVKDSMIFQGVDYTCAETLAAGDPDEWAAMSQNKRYTNAVRETARAVVKKYALRELEKLQKL